MRRTLFAALAILSTAPAHAAGVVGRDGRSAHRHLSQSRWRRSMSAIPSIADINMIDSRHAFILGKGYGSTNIVALDQDGKQVSNTHWRAGRAEDATVTLHRGAQRVTYSCTATIAKRRRSRATARMRSTDPPTAQIDTHHSGIAKKPRRVPAPPVNWKRFAQRQRARSPLQQRINQLRHRPSGIASSSMP